MLPCRCRDLLTGRGPLADLYRAVATDSRQRYYHACEGRARAPGLTDVWSYFLRGWVRRAGGEGREALRPVRRYLLLRGLPVGG